jgi:hypothetical protein
MLCSYLNLFEPKERGRERELEGSFKMYSLWALTKSDIELLFQQGIPPPWEMVRGEGEYGGGGGALMHGSIRTVFC